ncbi:nickel/cobalt efflux transporter [Vogesella sp. LIG4]|uniref:nickel/cobalt efflux transporter n=1 Tax=Vogesella sp. LIG4 TaxID=1192162 RepID=UPI00081F956B|nr:nickel/cobalt efflux transporter [Vogesella sp. LIG4]SCK18613.1 nickel/cobalt exporter [Vogesella sp. LIG4]
MPPIAELIQQGATNLWLFIPAAILLGALHGLEPGHSKTMMASFIIAIRGTIAQAVLLGLCAALSHSLVVWVLAAVALKFGNQLIAEQAEPYFMVLSGAIVIGVALWMFMRTRWDDLAARAQQHAPHGGRIINTGHGVVELLLHEDGVPPRFRLYGYDHHMQPTVFQPQEQVSLETIRPDGERQSFTLQAQGKYLESQHTVPEPHAFEVLLSIGHGDHAHQFVVSYREDGHEHEHAAHAGHHHYHDHHEHHHHDHAHDHQHAHQAGGEYQDAHERAHAEDIRRRFAGREVSTAQIAMFGLTGGLMPCPASVTILMICLHLKRFTLGVAMVASFSIGLAISLVSVGVIAAWGARQVHKRFGGLGEVARKMPYLSSVLMMVVGLVMGLQGLTHIV